MQLDVHTTHANGSFSLLTYLGMSAFPQAYEWDKQGFRVVMVRDRDSSGRIIYTVTACAV